MIRPTPPDQAGDVLVVDTGCANLASVTAAFARLGARALITDSPADVAAAPIVVLPGVGAFGPAIARLRHTGLDRALTQRVTGGMPLLAVCLGMQLLCHASDESPGVQGLGVVPGVLRRFPAPARTPQIGWNTIAPTPDARLLRPAAVYFANSYRLDALPPGWQGALADHAGPFVAAIERGPVLACQFHPELSGAEGLALLRRWLDSARAATVTGAAAC